MKLNVGINTILVDSKAVFNSGEYNIHEIEFNFDKAYNGLVKKAVFSDGEHTYQVSIVENKCTIPYEVLQKEGNITIGVYAYEVENDELVLRYSPKGITKYVNEGSYKEHYDNWEEVTPTDKEQIEGKLLEISNEMDNLNVEATKEENKTTITITKKDGSSYDVEVLDGEKGDKGDKGDPGAIKLQIVNELPLVGSEDTIYLVPVDDPEQSNRYDEYIYVNNAWEKLGGIQVEVDLTDYVKNTDYATSNKGGVFKTGNGIQVGSNGAIKGVEYTYEEYQNRGVNDVLAKGTLENVITGKGLTTKSYVDGLVGDIGTALDQINGESVGN